MARNGAAAMASYEIVRTAEGWSIFHDGRAEGSLGTKVAAFDHAVAAAVPAIRSGCAVVIKAASDSDGGSLPETRDTNTAYYEISPVQGGWAVFHDGRRETVLDSEMAAFDAAVGAAVASMGSGLATIIKVPAAIDQESLPLD